MNDHMIDRERVRDVLSIGIAVGVPIWGAVGAWTAVTVQNYPWNQWVPFANGASKGVLLGLLAAVGVATVLADGSRPGWRWAVFSCALIGGGLLGTIRDLLGPPTPAVYFEDSIPDERWYGTTMLLHWTGKVVLPAVVCAVILTLLVARPYRRAQSVLAGAALALAGVALLLLPMIASALAPEVQGNGQHVNEGFKAGLLCWVLGIPVLAVGMLRTFSLRTGRRGARTERMRSR
ncbi:hypothetical protein ACFQVD_39530 [Streptosporangium amethystogenes subsp. fukuiense]|uniref:DUF998 domain-containing protein n=1 Tax=Streptosporangium amethystogenes subsp. fukuiense TaxID=698418 RepID=A0ABW2TC01_9ACTN